MSPYRPPRAPGFTYLGFHQYFLAICTFARRPVFADIATGQSVVDQLMQIADEEQFAVIAYCAMPDHVHVVAEGETEAADLRLFMRRWKKMTGYTWKQCHGSFLWQEGYYDHVLRDEESLPAVVRYVLWNPVRAGLVRSPAEYPLLGSDRYTFEALADLVSDWRPPYGSRRRV